MTIAEIEEEVRIARDAYNRALESVEWNASGRRVRMADQFDNYRKNLLFWQRELLRAKGVDRGGVTIKPRSLT